MGQSDTLLRRLDLRGEIEHNNTNQILLPIHKFADLWALSRTIIHSLGDEFVKQIWESHDEYNKKTIVALQEATNSKIDKAHDMVIWKKGEDRIILWNGLLVVPRNRELRWEIIAACHNGPITRHPGQLCTHELVQSEYWWPAMIWDINQYIDRCPICLKAKLVWEKPIGELKPTEIPSEPWEIISVDFVSKLPESARKNTIMNMVNQHLKLLYSRACNTNITIEGAACLFLETAWQYEALPLQVISDRGPQFAATFTKGLNQLLQIKGSLTTAYHPQSNRQTEWVNQEMKIYLWIFINHYQNDWTQWLPLTTFLWNTWINPTTHRSPFEAAHGRHPRIGLEPTCQPSDDQLQKANDMVEKMKEVKLETESALKATAEDMKRFYNAKRWLDEFEVSNKVTSGYPKFPSGRSNLFSLWFLLREGLI